MTSCGIPGQYFDTTASACAVCKKDYYCPGNGFIYSCPTDSHTASTGAIHKEDCKCSAGYYVASGKCTICPADFYCPSDYLKKPCPASSSTSGVTGKQAITDCICSSGMYQSSGTCLACQPGLYCPGDNTAQNCPANSNSPARSSSLSNCACNPGSFLDTTTAAGACTACPLGSYCTGNNMVSTCTNSGATKEASLTGKTMCYCADGQYNPAPLINNNQCTACGDNIHFCQTGVKVSCPTGATTATSSSTSLSQCGCPAGQYLWGEGCLDCEPNKYCPGGAGNPSNSCPLLSYSQPGAAAVTDCVCSLSKYLDLTTSTCKDCPANSYCNGNNLASPCPTGFYSPANSYDAAQCTCQAGQYLDITVTPPACATCTVGNYCVGDNSQVACPNSKTSIAGVSSVNDCHCPSGQYWNGSACTSCPSGHYCPGDDLPYYCPGIATQNASDASRCDCPAGTYWAWSNTAGAACVDCPANSYCVSGSTAATACPSNSQSFLGAQALSDCLCNIGSFLDTSQCTTCPENYYCPGDNTKKQCPTGTISMISAAESIAIDACDCPVGSYLNGGVCTTCPANKFCEGNNLADDCPTDNADVSTATGLSYCYCKDGYYQFGASCEQCPVAYYCKQDATTHTTVKTPCPTGAESPLGSSTIDACQCPAGETLSNNACVACAAGSYCIGDNSQTTCPGSSTSVERSINCICPAGSYWENNACVDCPANSYCPGNNEVTACLSTATSAAKSKFVTDCKTPAPAAYNVPIVSTAITPTPYNELSDGQIVGVVLGLFGFAVCIIIATILLLKKYRNIGKEKPPKKVQTPQAYILESPNTPDEKIETIRMQTVKNS